jgi:hypothetical protein
MIMNKALTVLSACVDVRSGKRFTRGDEFSPAPNLEQAKRLIAAGCLPEEALKAVAGPKSDAEAALEERARTEAAEEAKRQREAAAAKAKRTGTLKQDGPTVAEYVAAGYPASQYPPKGYASRSTPEEIAAVDAEKQAADLDNLTIKDLQDLAKVEEIELGDASKKDDIVAAIRAARAAR